MEQKSKCKQCTTWEEEIYWNHFTSIYFSLTLPSHFHDHLKLPVKFSAHMKAQVPDKVSLKSPSGALWDVELLKSDDLVFVGDEWKDFVKANGLKEDCLLVFKYERNLGFEVLVFDQGNSCEKESSYFVKNCKHTKSDQEDQKKMVMVDAATTEIIEDNDDEEISFAALKKLRNDDEAEVCSGGKENAPSPGKGVISSASQHGGRLRKRKAQSSMQEKSIINEESTEVSHNSSQGNMGTDGNEDSYLKKNKSHESEALSTERSLNENDAITPENAENSPASNEPQQLKDQSGKQPSWEVTTSEPHQISEMNLLFVEDGDRFRVIDYPHNLETQTEKGPTLSRIGTTEEPLLITPENEEDTPLLCYSRRTKGQAEKKANERGISKMNRPDCGRSFRKNYHSSKSQVKSDKGRPKKGGLPKAPKESVFKSASDGKKSYGKVIPNRRPVTEKEKENALQRANKKQTDDSFTAVMRPSCVYTKFFLHIPAHWLHKHWLQMNQEIVLRVGQKTWQTSYRYYGKSYRGLISGWKKFAVENSLEEFDVLVFKPISQSDDAAFVLDVEIFRVVET